jgi:NAD-dependent DNA ligase
MTCPENCCIGITGTLETMTQDEAIKLIHEAGCAYAYTLSPDTTCLIVGKDPSEHALMNAETFNIHLVFEGEFADKIIKQRCGGDT